jgi:DNA-binding NarL/FixJ family response regulator
MKTWTTFDGDVALIVDDVPENLALLSDALSEAGYTVLVATDGLSALERLQIVVPDIILLDAVMPGIDGFETCRRIKQLEQVRHVPVVFMTGLTESEHVLKGFEAGGVDYVTKPIKPVEVLARMATHIQTARMLSQGQHELLLLQEEKAAAADVVPLSHYQLTPRETDVLIWVAKGKTNRDIAEIVGMSPRTVNKHLEHIYVKLGVETRSAAAALVAGRMPES